MRPLAFRRPNEKLRKLGVVVMWAGVVAILLPAPPADPLASAHEIFELVGRHYWWQFWGCTGAVVGNVLRLVGTQGHPGLPWPLFGRSDPFSLTRMSVRKRFSFHRRHPGFTIRRRWAASLR